MKWKSLKYLYFITISFLMMISVSVTFTLGYLVDSSQGDIPLEFGEVKIRVNSRFENNSVLTPAGEVEIVPGVYKKGVYLVNIVDNQSPNYIEKFRIDFDVYSDVPTYFRVRVVEQLTLTRISTSGNTTELSVLMEEPSDFHYETINWLDHRAVDDYFYYTVPVERIDANTPLNIGLITSYYSDRYYVSRELGYSLQIGIQIESVQIHGGPENNWGLPTPPWGGDWQ